MPEASPEESAKTESSNQDTASSEAVTDKKDTRIPSPTVMTILFIIIVLLGVIIFQNIVPRGGRTTAPSPAKATLSSDLEAMRMELNRERLALGLEPIGGSGIEDANEIAKRLSSDAETLASLATSFQKLLAQKDAQIDELRTESIAALKDQQRLRELLATANQDLRRAMADAAMAAKLQADLDDALSRITALQAQLAANNDLPDSLRQQLMESQQAQARLEAENQRLRAQMSALESQLNQAKLFASTENELLKEAIALVRALRKLQGATRSEMSTAYSQFGADLGANVMETCKFATGSSEIAPELNSSLSQLPGQAKENSMLLVVGYASETGNVDDNRILSSDRATAVAQLLDTIKRPNQRVQATYLGQTKRFSKSDPLENQRVEVWQIVPKEAAPTGIPNDGGVTPSLIPTR